MIEIYLVGFIGVVVGFVFHWLMVHELLEKGLKELRPTDRIFHDHIKAHFEKEHPEWKVICKICNRTYDDIVEKGLNNK